MVIQISPTIPNLRIHTINTWEGGRINLRSPFIILFPLLFILPSNNATNVAIDNLLNWKALYNSIIGSFVNE